MSWSGYSARLALLRAVVVTAVFGLAACGGSGTGSGPVITTGSNVAPIIVDAGPAGLSANLPFVSVTVCVPGTSNCQTIDHVLLDTGSTGLRIIATQLASTIVLPQPQSETTAPNLLYECMPFADGYSWGSVRLADVQVADGSASNMSIQLIGDPTAATVASDCAKNGAPENTVEAFGANGVLGVAVFPDDCGTTCATQAFPNAYYGCPQGGSCDTGTAPDQVPLAVTVSTGLQVANPVYHFATNNNGVVIDLPTPASIGQLALRGALILGIDTQANNQMGSAAVLPLNPVSGWFTTVFDGQTLTQSFIDSGSNGLFFPITVPMEATLPPCASNSGYYCPSPAVTLTATNQGVSGAISTVSFEVTNIDTLAHANPSYSVFPHVGGPPAPRLLQSFDWGLPFFFGRRVYVGFEGRSASAASGPFNAY